MNTQNIIDRMALAVVKGNGCLLDHEEVATLLGCLQSNRNTIHHVHLLVENLRVLIGKEL